MTLGTCTGGRCATAKTCMPPDPALSSTQWLRYARADLAVAGGAQALGSLPGNYCFHAQQAAEKAVKAVYAHLGIEHDLIHDLQRLLTVLPMSIPADVQAADVLTPYAVATRYPHVGTEPTNDDVVEAIELARTVVEWATSIVDPDPPEA